MVQRPHLMLSEELRTKLVFYVLTRMINFYVRSLIFLRAATRRAIIATNGLRCLALTLMKPLSSWAAKTKMRWRGLENVSETLFWRLEAANTPQKFFACLVAVML